MTGCVYVLGRILPVPVSRRFASACAAAGAARMLFPKKNQAPHEAEPVSGAVMPPPAEPEGGNEGARGESFPPDVFSVFSAFPAFTGERGGYGYRGRG